MLSILFLLLFALPASFAQLANVTNSYEFRSALANESISTIWLSAPFEIDSAAWTSPVNVDRKVLVYSPYRIVLDWCDARCNEGNPNWPLVVVSGELSFARIFFRNFVPRTPSNGSAFANSPAPAVSAAGGKVSFSLVIFHFQPTMTWVFNQSTWWQANAAAVKPVGLDGLPLQFQIPKLYAFSSYQRGSISFTNCFIPMDVLGCYGDLPFNTTLIYCPFTFRDSILNPYITKAVVFHSIGLDRTVYDFFAPWYLSRVVNYYVCPAVNVVFDMDWTSRVVVVQSGGLLAFHGISFASSASQNSTNWPPQLPLLLSAFAPVDNGGVSLVNCSIEVPSTADLSQRLRDLPGPYSIDPHRPNLQPTVIGNLSDSRYTIQNWVLPQKSWLTYSSGTWGPTTFGSECYWSFENVTVVEARQPWCFSGAINLGSINVTTPAKVQNCAQLAAQLMNTRQREIEVVADIFCTKDDFPSPVVQIQRPVEVRACHPVWGQRYVVDFGSAGVELVVSQRLYFEGSLILQGFTWTTGLSAAFNPLPVVLSQQNNALVQLENVIVIAKTAPGVLFESAQFQNAMLFPSRFENMTLVGNDIVAVDFYWRNVTDTGGGVSGINSYVGTTFVWETAYVTSSSSTVPVAAIVVPIIVGVILLILVVIAVLLWKRSSARKSGAQSGKGTEREHSSSAATSAVFMQTCAADDTCREGSIKEAGKESSVGTRVGPWEDIEAACKRMVAGKTASASDTLVLSALLGEGAYGKVYKGSWNGTVVAVKIMVLPSYLSGKEKRERMAVMETAISSSLSHPNIVQTYTYAVEPVRSKVVTPQDTALVVTDITHSLQDSVQSCDDVYSWEVRLVQEYCDKGSLRDHLNNRGFNKDVNKLDMLAILDTAIDIARAMAHLHRENIIHSDLKARNVLLKGCTTDPRGVVAKVADFGLSMKMDPEETHISNAYQGTMTHMAPETLMHGQVSYASDVYAFGILMWELYTTQQAYKGVAKALLGHHITQQNLRPVFPGDTPFDYQFLAFRCWESDPSIRPTFETVLDELKAMRRRSVESGNVLRQTSALLGSNTDVATDATVAASSDMSSYLNNSSTYMESSSGCHNRASPLADVRLPPVEEDATVEASN